MILHLYGSPFLKANLHVAMNNEVVFFVNSRNVNSVTWSK